MKHKLNHDVLGKMGTGSNAKCLSEAKCLSPFFLIAFCLILLIQVSVVKANDFDPVDFLDPNSINYDPNLLKVDNVKLTQVNLAAKMDKNSKELSSDLKKVMNQVNSFDLKNKQSNNLVTDDSNQQDSSAQQEQKPQIAVQTPALPIADNKTIKPQTQSELDKIVQQPDKVKNPIDLANILYRCGRYKDASVFYRKSLELAADSNNHDVMYKDKAWLLFQSGNSYEKQGDYTSAGKMYKQLIIEYPDSMWTAAAKAKDHLADWYIQQDPKNLLKKGK